MHQFISYSAIEALEFALELHNKLEAGPPKIEAWLDKYDLHPGGDWESQIVEAIRVCDGVLFVMTKDSVRYESVCREEWSRALRYKKPIVPLLLHRDIEPPLMLQNRQFIDFTKDFDGGLAKLRDHLRWLASPAGLLQTMKDRRKDLERSLPRASDDTERARIEDELRQLEQDIVRQQEIVNDPEAAKRRMEASIERGLERERQPEKPVAGKATTKFINNPPGIAPNYFQDRHVETQMVAQALQNEATRLVTVVGRGGTGKTAMVCRLLKALESGKLPDDLGEMRVDGIVYLSANVHKLNLFPRLYADLCKLISADATAELEALAKDPKASADTKMLALLEHFSEGRYVLLLDNFEDVMDAEKRVITDADTDVALRALLNAPHHSLNTIITTRVLPFDLPMVQPGRQTIVRLDEGLESPYAENLLREMDTDGKLGLRDLPEDDPLLKAARERTRGYPRALEALVGALNADSSTTLPDLLEQLAVQEAKEGANNPLREFIVEAIVGEAYSRLDPNAQRVMQALAIYGRPVTPSAVDYLLQPYSPGLDSAPVLNRLANMHFARAEAGRYYLHPVDRAYALERIPKGEESDRFEAGQPMFTQTALFHRAANYFVETRKPRAEWKKLDDLAPQLAEFELRFEGGDYDTAARVLGEITFNYLLLWGYARLVAQLYERLDGKLTNAFLNMWKFNNLALAYNRLGQPHRAIDLYKQGLNLARETDDKGWEGAFLNNLGEANRAIGEVERAMRYYEQALEIAQNIGDQRAVGIRLGNLGQCYSSLGQTSTAILCFEEALEIRREMGDLRGQAFQLTSLAEVFVDQGELERSLKCASDAIEIADSINHRQLQSEAREFLCFAHLYSNHLAAARAAAEAACSYDVPENNHNVFTLLGIVALRQGDRDTAQDSFSTAVSKANEILAHGEPLYEALDAKGLALCGLAVLGDTGRLPEAIECFKLARAKTMELRGAIARVLRLFDALALADTDGVLAGVREVVGGEKPSP